MLYTRSLSQLESTFPALTLTHVCSRWRDIALSNPSFWSRMELRVQLENATDKSISAALFIIELCLARSGQSPLDLVIEFTDIFFQRDETFDLTEELYQICFGFLPIYRIFFDQAHRWRNAHLFLPRNFFGPRWYLNADWPEYFPILEELAVHIIGYSDDCIGTLPSIKISAPRLHTLTHTGYGVAIVSSVGDTPPGDGSSVANADSSNKSSFDSLRSLTFSQSLHQYELCLASPLTTVTMRRISGFTYSGSEKTTCLARNIVILPETDRDWTLQSTLDYMTCPNLASFSLEIPITQFPSLALVPQESSSNFGHNGRGLSIEPVSEPSTDNMYYEKLADLLVRGNAANITHFSIINIRLKDDHIIHILSRLPSLSHLALADTVFRDYSDPGDHYAGAYNEAESAETERQWRRQGSPLMLSRSLFNSLSFCDGDSPSYDPVTYDPLLHLTELHVGFSRGQGRGGIFALLDMVQSRTRKPVSPGLQFVRIKLVSDWNSDCSDFELYYESEEHLHLEEEIGEVVKERLDQLGEVGIAVELEWADTLREWRAGLGCWKID
ncbi:hypothetical protein VKT23_012594 [Stygiomarasmius scandens]|uniref:F-box domain-containing protein n=1 Tax=Marasmiellus scandens TaxID=2682957 RepID=A0ABR1J8Y5_9AGAR